MATHRRISLFVLVASASVLIAMGKSSSTLGEGEVCQVHPDAKDNVLLQQKGSLLTKEKSIENRGAAQLFSRRSNLQKDAQHKSTEVALVHLGEFVDQQHHKSEHLSAWQEYLSKSPSLCALKDSGFGCEEGQKCEFKDQQGITFTMQREGNLLKMSTHTRAFFVKIGSSDDPSYFLTVVEDCDGTTILVKAPVVATGDNPSETKCSDSHLEEQFGIMDNEGDVQVNTTVDVETKDGKHCIKGVVSETNMNDANEGACLLKKTAGNSTSSMIPETANTVTVAREAFFILLEGNNKVLQEKLSNGSCQGKQQPAFALVENDANAFDKSLVRKSRHSGDNAALMVAGVGLWAAAFALTTVSGGAFAPAATIVFGWGSALVVTGANNEWGAGQSIPGTGGALGPTKGAETILSIGVNQIRDALSPHFAANGSILCGGWRLCLRNPSAEAKSCPGWDCTVEGQYCPPGVTGSHGLGYCCKASKWVSGKCDWQYQDDWQCRVGIGGTGTGAITRVSLADCKTAMAGKSFRYYPVNQHCEQVSGYTGITDGNAGWVTCMDAWQCAVGIGGTGTGAITRVSLADCKKAMAGKSFRYYPVNQHCEQVSGYTGTTDGNAGWQTCMVPCVWASFTKKHSPGFAGGVSTQFSSADARTKCIQLGSSTCQAITCEGASSVPCTVRGGSTLLDAPSGYTTYVGSKTCFQ